MVAKLVPVQLEDGAILYIEAQEDTETEAIAPTSTHGDTGEQRRGGAKGMGDMMAPLRPSPTQSMQMVQSTIRTYTLNCLNAFKDVAVANIEEVTFEFGINLSADAGIPYIASGKAQSNLKITVKCSYNQPEPEITEETKR
jgi:hypothetical protein